MYSRPIVPKGFVVPQRVQGEGFHLRMLTIGGDNSPRP